jgi:hypothetical protein
MRGNSVVLASLALLIAASAPVAAETELQTYLAARQTFESLEADAAKVGDAPRLSDPRVRDTLAILSNASGTLGSPSFPVDDEAMQRDLCSVPIRTAFDYLQFGGEAFVDEKVEEKQLSATSSREAIGAVMDELGERNMLKFQDEVVPLLAFAQRCIAGEAPWLTSFLEKLPPEQMTEVRRQGLRGFRGTVKQMAMEAVGLLANPLVHEDNRRLMLRSAARNLPALSEALSPDERAQVKREVEKLGADAPQADQPDIALILQTLNNTQCEGLCRL